MIRHKQSKAGLLLQLLGNNIPQEVFNQLTPDELDRLASRLTPSMPGVAEQNRFLKNFNQLLSSSVDNGIEATEEPLSLLDELYARNKEELWKIIRGEEASIIARVLFFANPDEASLVLADLPDRLLSDVITEIQNIDQHSEDEKEKLERFLGFKSYLIKNSFSPSRTRDSKGKKMAEILGKLSPNSSLSIFSKISKNNPEFAENIREHLHAIGDLIFMDREELSSFLSGFHPIIIACALKGVETDIKYRILNCLEPWLMKKVVLESDSMGPVSLAEIEEAQKGILDRLAILAESGKIRIWK